MDVRLPQLAEGADSGTVVSILVSEGDAVEKEQTILELENEKAIAPIPSTAAGTVSKIHVNEGDTVSVGDVLITVGEGGGEGGGEAAETEAAPKEAPQAAEEPEEYEESSSEPQTQYAGQSMADPIFGYRYESKSGYPPPAAPSIRNLAREIGLDLRNVRGTSKGGRITLNDIRNYIARLHELAFEKQKESKAAGKPAKSAQPFDFSKWGDTRREKLSSIRKTIGSRMQDSWNTIPHVYQFDEADITDLMDLRKNYKSAYSKKDANLTLTAIVIKAITGILKDFPLFNASLDEASEELVYKEFFHIGCAVDTDAGLLVPVIRDAGKKPLVDICKELQEAAEKARERKLSSEDMQGSSFTISNLGGIGGQHFTPIVNSPNTAILGIGRGVQKPAVVNGEIKPRIFMPLCVSYDHRIIDGAAGARFIKAVVERFEQFPESELKINGA